MPKGEYAFGGDGPFQGLRVVDPKNGEVVLEYTPNPKQALLHNTRAFEVFYGGATYGGKTMGALMHTAAHCLAHGKDANTVFFRRTYDQLEKSVILEVKRHLDGVLGTYRSEIKCFEWHNKARTWFRHMETADDLQKNQGVNYSLVVYDELTHFEEPMYTEIFPWCRAPYNPKIFCQVISTSNPRGIGHRWVYERFIKDREPFKVYTELIPEIVVAGKRVQGRSVSRCFIPAYATDNTSQSVADYLSRLRASMSDDKFNAWVMGDWKLLEGSAFPEWSSQRHVIEDFNIPPTWKVIRSLDPGIFHPFYVGWLAQNPDTGEIYLINEWYGASIGKKGGLHGLEITPEALRTGILSREESNIRSGFHPKVRIGPSDPDLWKHQTGEYTRADLLNEGEALFFAGNRDHKLGNEIIHTLLRPSRDTGEPKFRVFKGCRVFAETFPNLAKAEHDPDDIERGQEDHAYDAVRYGLVELMRAPAVSESKDWRHSRERGIQKRPMWV